MEWEGIFIGIVAGAFAAFLIYLFIVKAEGKYAIVGIAAYIGIFILFLCNMSTGKGFFCGGYFPASIVMGYILYAYYNKNSPAPNKNHEKKESKQYLYLNHCWNCGNPIDSNIDKLCMKCGQHYICSRCGKCWCDDPKNGFVKLNNRNITGSLSLNKYSTLEKYSADEKENFYLNFRMAQELLNALKIGAIKASIDFRFDRFNELAEHVNKYCKPNPSFTKHMIGNTREFINSKKWDYDGYTFDNAAINALCLTYDMVIKLDFDLDYVTRVNYESKFLAIVNLG